jgi:serine/threonine-protein kinase
VVALTALAAVSAGLLGQPRVRERPVVRFTIDTSLAPPAHDGVSPRMAVSPDGRRIAFVGGRGADGQATLYVREIDRIELRALAGTEGAAAPFFSPDGRWIGFFAGGSLKKVPVGSGPIVTLAGAPHTLGATWLPDGTIVFGGGRFPGLSRVSSQGGTTTRLTMPDLDAAEIRHAWPDASPTGRGLVFTALSADEAPESARVAAIDLRTGRIHAVVAPGVRALFAPPGHLLFSRGPSVLAAPFDENSWSLVGPAVAVLRDPLVDAGTGVPQLAVSRAGVLVTSSPAGVDLVRDVPTGLAGSIERSAIRAFDLSPSNRLAMAVGDGDGVDLYAADAASTTRLTARGGVARPVWTADGRSIVYAGRSTGAFNLFMRPAEADAAETRLTMSPRSQMPSSVAADGSALVFTQIEPDTGMDVWLLPLDRSPSPVPLVQSADDQTGGVLSPDKRWLVYLSESAGTWTAMAHDRHDAAARNRVLAGSRAGARLGFSQDGRTLAIPGRDGRRSCTVSEAGIDCRKEELARSTAGQGSPPAYRFEVVLDWSRELATLVPSPQQPVQSVR